MTPIFLPTPSARRATIAPFGIMTDTKPFLPTPSARRATAFSSFFQRFVIVFLPTPSARRATHRRKEGRTDRPDFYPRPPRGGRRPRPCPTGGQCRFLPTPSARRATRQTLPLMAKFPNFYPRPPRGGRRLLRERCNRPLDFYPRPPRGGRPSSITVHLLHIGFLPTPSARRATSAVF